VSPRRLQSINRSVFTVSVTNTGSINRMVTLSNDLSANMARAGPVPRLYELAERLMPSVQLTRSVVYSLGRAGALGISQLQQMKAPIYHPAGRSESVSMEASQVEYSQAQEPGS